MKDMRNAWQILLYLSCIAMAILLVWALYQFVILTAPPEVAAINLGKDADVLTKLGPRTAVAIIIFMIALMALVFWLFISFGRRLSMRHYLGPLAQDAIARAEIARREDRLREDLRSGKIEAEFEPGSEEFNKRYQIPTGEKPPNLIPGVTIDQAGRILEYEGGWGGTPLPGLPRRSGRSRDPWASDRPEEAADIEAWTADRLVSERKANMPVENEDEIAALKKSGMRDAIQDEITRRFRDGYRREQLNAFFKKRGEITAEERDRAEKLLPTMDVSSFGGGWAFVLEFTTIIFIVFAVLALGLLGVLKSEPIGAILAAIAGYVLGKSTSIRGAGGEEIRRGAEEPKVLFEAMTKQEEIRSLRDEEKVKLQREVEDLQRKLTQGKVTVPAVVGLAIDQAENKVKEKNLVPDRSEVENSGADAGKVFQQSPAPNAEVAKGSTVMLFVAKKPTTP